MRLQIGDFPDPRHLVRVGFGDEDDFVRSHLNQVSHDVQELAGEILVDEQEIQRAIPNGGRWTNSRWTNQILRRESAFDSRPD
jgi:hypothetical protein